ncbi:MAG: homocysteine S-methyltransferase family protein [Lachnospiraceae bacterium]|nr:homocysteine S-methyltransferase family protein [Lachnospiraceae bacterium]
MNREEFRKLTENNILLLDGATGTNLQKRGLPKGVCPDRWIMDNPEVMIKLQTEYLSGGSRIIYSPTFSCNRAKLEEYGLQNDTVRMNRELAGISRAAIDRFRAENPSAPKCFVAGNLSMTGIQLAPVGPMDFEELISIYSQQISALCEGGVDLIVVETMMSLQETRAAVIAAREACDLPVMATMTFEEDGRSLYGTDPLTALITLQSLGADAFGINCGAGPDRMLPLIESMSGYAKIPIICKPNAGLPSLDENGDTVYDLGIEDFAKGVEKIIKAGASIVGGCCGTDPGYIRAVADIAKDHQPRRSAADNKRALSSERSHLIFSLDSPFMIIGERINPTGKKKLQAELREGSFELVRTFAEEQEKNGAAILDVNMGMGGIDEKEMMKKALDIVTQEASLPLCIDTSFPEVMETALRRYPGRALMNSISAESDRCDKMLAIAKKYGAMFILLPLGDSGLPKDRKEKEDNIRLVYDKAMAMGFSKEDIVVDGLVGTVGAIKSAGLDTLETIKYCRELGLATVCGLSNISFGLPERINVNTAFLSMAIRDGLTMAICNPNQDAIVRAALSTDLLMNKEGADIRYIEYMNENAAAPDEKKVPEKTELTPMEEIRQCVIKGNEQNILNLTKKALDGGSDPNDILNNALISAINEVGDLFEKGRYFLPQLIASAKTMEASISILEPLLENGSENNDAPVIVIATVEGDIHDIGKNLVTLMLKNYGFRVTDLGKNVPKEQIIKTAMELDADIICLSALMTTTMKEMENVIAYAKERNCRARFMVGGAVITQEYADEIGADAYSSDASDAVRVAKRICGIS